MSKHRQSKFVCAICKQEKPSEEGLPGELVHKTISKFVQHHTPDWNGVDEVCFSCLDLLRAEYIEDAIKEEGKALSRLEKQSARSLEKRVLQAQNLNVEFD